SALVEIYQNCPIFNDGAFDVLKEPGQKEQRLIPVEHGEPIVFGDRAVVRGEYGLEIAPVADVDADRIVVHDTTVQDPAYAFALSRLSTQDLAHVVTGVYRAVDRPAYDDQARDQVAEARARPADLQHLLDGPDTWLVN
ncbi:MAG TPA: 2-oxoacid:ferredoxin oxidoreductase subunit beta, partial [Actinophytocola sp.]|nr:2-oxoacid:ferredoxin oxidoreductase subunit beta [Actinophytocola sp.]